MTMMMMNVHCKSFFVYPKYRCMFCVVLHAVRSVIGMFMLSVSPSVCDALLCG